MASVATVVADGAGLLSFAQFTDTFEVSFALKATKTAELASLRLLIKTFNTTSVFEVLDSTWDDLLVTATAAAEEITHS